MYYLDLCQGLGLFRVVAPDEELRLSDRAIYVLDRFQKAAPELLFEITLVANGGVKRETDDGIRDEGNGVLRCSLLLLLRFLECRW